RSRGVVVSHAPRRSWSERWLGQGSGGSGAALGPAQTAREVPRAAPGGMRACPRDAHGCPSTPGVARPTSGAPARFPTSLHPRPPLPSPTAPSGRAASPVVAWPAFSPGSAAVVLAVRASSLLEPALQDMPHADFPPPRSTALTCADGRS